MARAARAALAEDVADLERQMAELPARQQLESGSAPIAAVLPSVEGSEVPSMDALQLSFLQPAPGPCNVSTGSCDCAEVGDNAAADQVGGSGACQVAYKQAQTPESSAMQRSYSVCGVPRSRCLSCPSLCASHRHAVQGLDAPPTLEEQLLDGQKLLQETDVLIDELLERVRTPRT